VSEREMRRNHREIWDKYSDGQVLLLRSLREVISHKRWEIMLDIDEVENLIKHAKRHVVDREACLYLTQALVSLDRIHQELARIPEDIIPAF
jgi:hypothetical protein